MKLEFTAELYYCIKTVLLKLGVPNKLAVNSLFYLFANCCCKKKKVHYDKNTHKQKDTLFSVQLLENGHW